MVTSSAGAERSRRIRVGALSRQADFDRIYRQGRRQRGQFVTAVVLFREEPPACRAAFVVSRKVSKLAVRRNRVRRRLREVLRQILREQGLVGQPDLILIASPRSLQATYWDLLGEVRGLLRRSGMVGEPVTVAGEAEPC